MRKCVLVVVMVVLFAAAIGATGTKEDPVTGTWYGGAASPVYEYIYTFSPLGPGRWQVLCFPASAPGAYGPFVMMTPFSGEVRKTGSGYELRLMTVGAANTNVPPDTPPSVMAARAQMSVVDADTITLVYDTAGAYTWGTVPFVDNAAGWAYRPGNGGPVNETIHRLNVTVDINLH